MHKLRIPLAIAVNLVCCCAFSQTPAAPDNNSSSGAAATPAAQQGSPCAKPIRIFSPSDYSGPGSRHVSGSAKQGDVNTVYQLGLGSQAVQPCPYSTGDKFKLFVHNSVKPTAFAGAAWDAGFSQVNHDDPTFGQGAEGYGKRFGAAMADHSSHQFFGTFVYPTIFRQDPRYYRLGDGTTGQRFSHALMGVFVAHSNSGNPMPNYSEWLGTASYKTLGDLYHPGYSPGVMPVVRRSGIAIGEDMGWNVVREFWPEIVHKFHLPFRNHETAENQPDSTSKPAAFNLKPAPMGSSSGLPR